MWSLQFAASNIGGKCSPTSVQRLSDGCGGLGLLLSPSSPVTLSFCWPDCAVHMCLLGIFGVWDGDFIPCASCAPACGLVLIWGTKLGSWGAQLGTSCRGIPPSCWWVVQDLPSRWYENADGNGNPLRWARGKCRYF